MQAKRTGFDQRWLRTRCVLRSSGSDHVTQIASQICAACCSLTVSQIVQLAALGIAEVIVRRASPAGLKKYTVEHRSGCASPLLAVSPSRVAHMA
jgi:hypothetical protein